jgi:hypothetical protein
MLDRNNQHLFLEDEKTDGGSFIANVNKIVDNLIPLQELNDKLTPDEVNNLLNLANNVNEVGGNLPVVATGSTEARKLSDRFSDVVNVKDFGAKGDGVSDDTDALCRAFAHAGGTCILHPGTYLVRGTIPVTAANLFIHGPGATIVQTVPGTMTLLVNQPTVTISHLRFVNTENMQNVRERDVAIKLESGADYFTLEHCKFEHFKFGIYATTGNTLPLLKNMTIKHCHFDAYEFGMLLDDFDGVVIDGCVGTNIEMSQPTSSGVGFDPPHLVYITDRSWLSKRSARITNCLETGNIYSSSYKVRNCNDVVIQGCTSLGCCRGIEIDYCKNVNISGNNILDMVVADDKNGIDNYQNAIYVSSTDNGVIANNLVDIPAGVPAMGIRITASSGSNTNNVTLSNNTITLHEVGTYLKHPISIMGATSVKAVGSIFNTHGDGSQFLYYIADCEDIIIEGSKYSSQADHLNGIRFVYVIRSNNVLIHYDQSLFRPEGHIINTLDPTASNVVEAGPNIIPSVVSAFLPPFRTSWNAKTGIKPSNSGIQITIGSPDKMLQSEAFRSRLDNEGDLRNYYFSSRHTFTGDVIPGANSANSLGYPSSKWSQLYAASGTINTSDARKKTNIAAIDERAFRAWGKVPFRQFLFNSSVEKKGSDNARVHTGIIAQDIKAAFEEEGLDPTRYALFCYDSWDAQEEEVKSTIKVLQQAIYDEDGYEIQPEVFEEIKEVVSPAREAGSLYGIRYEEALCLEAAYQRQMAAKLEARIAALEAATTPEV